MFKDMQGVSWGTLVSAAIAEKYAGRRPLLVVPRQIGKQVQPCSVETALGVAATGRNLNTVSKLAEMVQNAQQEPAVLP